jgi:CheY-like chemotaxis protein
VVSQQLDKPSIIYVEDDDSEATLVETLLKKIDPELRCERIRSVETALQLLSVMSMQESSEKPPQLILLDLHLAPGSGYDVLQAVRKQKRLDRIPVVVFSSSTSAREEAKSLRLGAFAHLKKPARLPEYLGVLRQIIAMIPAQIATGLCWF